MDDRELLGLLAGEAPAPKDDLADAVVRSGRRVRTRRRMAVLGGSAAFVAAVGFFAPAIISATGGADDSKQSSVAAEAPAAQNDYAAGGPSLTSGDTKQKRAAPEAGNSAQDSGALKVHSELAVYAAALTQIPGDLAIEDRTPQGLAPAFRRALSTALPDRKIVFIGPASKTAVAPGTHLVTLGDAEIDGTTAQVWLSRDGRPLAPVHLTEQDGQWTVLP